MGFLKIIKFSNLAGKAWLDKEEVQAPPTMENMSKLYDKIQKSLDMFNDKMYKYLNYTIKQYGYESDDIVDGEMCLDLNKKGIKTIYTKNERKAIFVETKNSFTNINTLSMGEQMEIMQLVGECVKNKKKRSII